jgi:hypothetical protein
MERKEKFLSHSLRPQSSHCHKEKRCDRESEKEKLHAIYFAVINETNIF